MSHYEGVIPGIPLPVFPFCNMATARDAAGAVYRERKTNFNDDELSCLLEENAQHASVLQCKLSNNVTNLRKKPDLGRNSHESEFAWQRTAHCGRIEKKVGGDEERQPSHHLRSSLPQDRGWQKRKRAVVCQPGAGHIWC